MILIMGFQSSNYNIDFKCKIYYNKLSLIQLLMIHKKVKMILINIVIFSIFNQICYWILGSGRIKRRFYYFTKQMVDTYVDLYIDLNDLHIIQICVI
jgi:hypothetical protein